ncbi:MAG: AAA family ATPase, partial [Acetobacteraceae bacterium]
MRCRRCEADNPQSARFCDSCGAELDRACDACGASNRAGARFCSRCGLKFDAAERQEAAPATVPGYLSGEGERKLVTVLVADLRGSTAMIRDLDPEQAIGRLDPGVKAMAAAVEACGGVVNRVQGDGIMALFGAPIAREDHAIRACLAAHRMLAATAALEVPDLEVRVGVNSGEVVIRATGSDATDYDAVGITVHLANRLEQSARPGTARLSALTARLARGFTDVLPLGALEFRGLDTPIEVFELLDATERPAWEVRAAAASLTPFVGRQAEIAMLTGALGRACLGRGQAVLVVADAGVGKSRLIHEFLREVPSGSFAVLRAAASSHALGSPFQIAAMLLRSWIGAEAVDSGATIERRLRQALVLNAGAAALDGPALRALLDLPVEDADWTALDPPRRRERIIEALRVLMLREAAARPLILVIEDLHWVD